MGQRQATFQFNMYCMLKMALNLYYKALLLLLNIVLREFKRDGLLIFNVTMSRFYVSPYDSP